MRPYSAGPEAPPATAPGAPAALSAVAGNQSVTLLWSAPASNGGSAVTDYVVRYSDDSGSSWTSYTDQIFTGTGGTITGLTNGAEYIFEVAAVNAAGQGAYATSSPVSPSSAALPDDPHLASVVLHLHCDGANGSTTFTDSGPRGLLVVANGTAQVSTAQSRFGTASLLVGGSGFLEIADSELMEFGQDDFTLEACVRFTSTSGIQQFINKDFNGTSGRGFQWRYNAAAGMQFISHQNNSVFSTATAAWTPEVNRWYSIAVTRMGFTTVRMFVDGTLIGSGPAASFFQNSTAPLRIGASAYAGSEGYFSGNIDEVRITQGVERYRSSYTAATTPFQDKGATDPFFASTSLLLHMDGVNNATAFTDSSRHSRVVTANGDARVNAALGKYAQCLDDPSSAGDFLSVPGTAMGFSTTDFSIECWYMRTADTWTNSIASGMWQPENHVSGGSRAQFYVQSDNRLVFAVWGSELVASAALTWTPNQWYHVAVTRSGSTMRLFRDGVLLTSASRANALNADTAFRVQMFNPDHYVDDLRITRGVARYVMGYTPPAAAHPDFGTVPQSSDAASWMDRVYANGGSVTARTADAVNRFCNAIEAAGIRGKFYRLNLFGGMGLNSCIVPLYRGPSLAGTQYGNAVDTNVGPFTNGDFSETRSGGGLRGNGTSKYLQTGLAGNVLATGDRHLCAYEVSREPDAYRAFLGTQDEVGGTYYWTLSTGADATTITGVTGAFVSSTGNSVGGMWLMSEPSNSSTILYKNGASVASSSSALRGLPSAQTIPVFAYQASPSSPSIAGYSSARLGAYSIGLSLSEAQAAAYYNAMQAFQTALGRQV